MRSFGAGSAATGKATACGCRGGISCPCRLAAEARGPPICSSRPPSSWRPACASRSAPARRRALSAGCPTPSFTPCQRGLRISSFAVRTWPYKRRGAVLGARQCQGPSVATPTVEKLVKCPVADSMRPIPTTDCPAVMSRRHSPAPSPSVPINPSGNSSAGPQVRPRHQPTANALRQRAPWWVRPDWMAGPHIWARGQLQLGGRGRRPPFVRRATSF